MKNMPDGYTVSYAGRLSIHAKRGVLYFHDEAGQCLLRIEGLTKPTPDPSVSQIDIRLLNYPVTVSPHELSAEQSTGTIFATILPKEGKQERTT